MATEPTALLVVLQRASNRAGTLVSRVARRGCSAVLVVSWLASCDSGQVAAGALAGSATGKQQIEDGQKIKAKIQADIERADATAKQAAEAAEAEAK